MITLGVDAHKKVHAAVAVDDAGQEIAQCRLPNSAVGWAKMHDWAASLGEARQWGIEGAWSYGRGLAQSLIARGDVVYEINTRWTAIGRRSARRPGKTDSLDANAIALLVMREVASLPAVHAEDETVLLDVLTSEREAALAEATRLRNQIHALLMQVDPEYRGRLPTINSKAGVKALMVYRPAVEGELQASRVAAIRRVSVRLDLALAQADEVEKRIDAITRTAFAPLTEICGVSLLTAAALAGILGPGRRFASDAQLAAYAGAAPLEASSAGYVRHRLNRGGNRRLNAILYRIVLTQSHYSPEARAYLERRTTEGKTRREAMRALKRFVVRAIWHQWLECLPAHCGEIASAA
jgi:transposase